MFRAFKSSIRVCLFLPLWLCAWPASANLLTNGSFENPVVSGPWERYSSIPGWTGSFDLHRDLPVADGAQLVDINQNSYGWIAQSFATTPGATYQLSFSHGVNYYCQSSALFAVEIDGEEIARFDTGRALQEKALTFTAADSNTELKFTSLSAGCGATTIDNVTVIGDNVCAVDYSFMLPFNNPVNSLDEVEVAARVYRPCDEDDGSPYPLLVFMHGQHNSCAGSCNEGFDYLAGPLANDGFVVVSIKVSLPGSIYDSEPLSFTYRQDPSLTVMRGRLLLTHLEHWAGWTDPALSCQSNGDNCAPASLTTDGDGLRGLIDWRRVGLLGHSRGGEAVRAAYNLLNPAGSDIARMDSRHQYDWQATLRPEIRAIFEFAPVDRTTAGPRNQPFLLDANGIAWHVMLPVCDGDVDRLSGIMPFDRMLAASRADVPNTPKSAMTIRGANHAFFNSQLTDPENQAACTGDDNTPLSATQQQALGQIAATEFFRAHVRDGLLPRLFNPLYQTPEWQQMQAVTRVERSFSATPHRDGHIVLHDFNNRGGIQTEGTLSFAVDDLRSFDPQSEHDPVQRALAVEWNTNGAAPSLRIQKGQQNLQGFCSLDFRVARQPNASNLNNSASTSFSLRLIYRGAKGGTVFESVPLPLRNYLDLTGPAGGGPLSDPHAILQTVRIPLQDFGVADLSRVRGLRLLFDDTPSGAVYLANVRVERDCD